MEKINYCCALVCIATLVCLTGFSASSETERDDSFNPKNCTSDEQCAKVCFPGVDNTLYSRCDVNGTCICDCSSTSNDDIPSSYVDACKVHQPDGYYRDYCDRYCTQEYLRPCRYCNDSGNFYCTCVCPK